MEEEIWKVISCPNTSTPQLYGVKISNGLVISMNFEMLIDTINSNIFEDFTIIIDKINNLYLVSFKKKIT